MFEASIKNKKIEISKKGGNYCINGHELILDIEKRDDFSFHILKGSNSFTATLVNVDSEEKSVTIKINNRSYRVVLKDRMDLLLQKMGYENKLENSSKEIIAPMPGLIIDVLVTQGMMVRKGDALLILEAMKMENVIKSPRDGQVSIINVRIGESVEKNHTMIEL